MKKFLILLITLSFLGCYQTERDCKLFKTGKFYSEVTIDGVLYTSEFERFEYLQVETYNQKSDSAQVRWINDCEVVFKTIHPKSMADHKDIHLKILTTTDSSYTFEYSYVGETKKQKGMAFKIR
ncbi:MAG: DNA topoisomerase IV [Flavobacteriales bacterium]|nr:DNA topoisomerase IV [Flavobacteriia bacterium]NCP60444.1 DNA topoisomerase IV [Flavobacteriales bacterium]NCP90960.1 DNA topoisomerase IV [Flavobacteriales bacterium]PIV92849.1 MAG: DNA topoisomerase IV [Flavobacteriaceae bacterium CG17_big_fil_post_rev_8_21_14_2_50_33_15]